MTGGGRGLQQRGAECGCLINPPNKTQRESEILRRQESHLEKELLPK